MNQSKNFEKEPAEMPRARDPVVFLADDIGIVFVNSLAAAADPSADLIGSGGALLRWLKETRLVPEDVLTLIKNKSEDLELNAIAGQARVLREWFGEFIHAHKGQILDAGVIHDLIPLNQILEKDHEFGQILVNESALRWSLIRQWDSPSTLLLPVASVMARFICSEDFTRIKSCEGISCTMIFIDRTPRNSRRWCNMATCGNRAKQAAHRARQIRKNNTD